MTASTGISRTRKRFFAVITIVSPIIIILLLELILRSAHYGGDLSLVTRQVVRGKECYAINRSVAHRYFAGRDAFVPQPVEGTFSIEKPKNTKRVFCLGESTMEGFPYEQHATVTSLIHDRLSTLLPGYTIEVINVGLSAIGTFVVQDFMDELVSYEPDLFIVYIGHNEFYGVYGMGSTVAIPGGAWLTRLTVTLLKFKTFLLARDGYVWLREKFSGGSKPPSESLMGQMVAHQTIPFRSDIYNATKDIYGDNLARIITTAQSHKVPILFGTLVSNWRGQKPFVSISEGSAEHKQLWTELTAKGDSAINRKDTVKAVQHYLDATRIDSTNAGGFFTLGTVFYSLGNYPGAKQALIRAKDLDALRFRATTEFEDELIEVCTRHDVPLARLDSAFSLASVHGILDDDLFLEHLHPNFNGYFLMAKTFCDAVEHHSLLAAAPEWKHTNTSSDSALLEYSRVTQFDKTVGKVKIDLLKRRWPFETGNVNYQFVAANPEESVVFRMMKGGIDWTDARYLLAEFYSRNKQFTLAEKECLAVAKVLPFSYEPLLRYAHYCIADGKNTEARESLESILRMDPTNEDARKLLQQLQPRH